MPILAFACWGGLKLGDVVVGRNFSEKVAKHAETLVPSSDDTSTSEHAWDSRIGGIISELSIWSRSPLTGRGFGAGETAFLSGKLGGGYVSIKHNGWTSTLAETGLFGFVGLVLLVGSMMVLGYRMVHDRTSSTYVLFGAIVFATGVVYFIRCCCTMAITSRTVLDFGLVCGMAIRAREMQETEVALAWQQEQAWQPYVDEQTGMLVPDYEFAGDLRIQLINLMQRVLITGSSGLIGSEAVTYFDRAAGKSSASTTTCAPTSSDPKGTPPGTCSGFNHKRNTSSTPRSTSAIAPPS